VISGLYSLPIGPDSRCSVGVYESGSKAGGSRNGYGRGAGTKLLGTKGKDET